MPNIIETSDAANNTSTIYSLTAGQTAQGNLSSGADHDWYYVDLVQGQTYTFAVTGTGSGNVQDPTLRLALPGGSTFVTPTANGLPGSNEVLTYTAPATGRYYIDAGGTGAGQYGVSFTAGSRASFDTQMGGGVIDTDQFWGVTNLTYGARDTNFNNGEPTFSHATTVQMATVTQILQMYSEVCNLTFTQVSPGGFTNNATILVSDYSANDGAGAYAYYPSSGAGQTLNTSVAGDLWLNTSVSQNSLPTGSYSYFAIMHELGHAMGLSHPGKYNAALGVSITYDNSAQFTQDTQQYTVMSYFDESNTTTSYGSNVYPDTLMLFDVYELQQIYGANGTTRSGDTIYGFNGNAGGVYNFTTNTNPAMCIWDGGGIDTLNVSGFSQAELINLNPGSFSNVGGLVGNVSIALNCTIENVTCGNGADQIYLSGAVANNLISGGGGTDTVHVTYTFGSGAGYTISGTAANLTMSGAAGTDTFQGCEFIIFSNGTQVSTSDLAANQTVVNVAISDVTIAEGNAGTKVATFTVTREGGTAAFAVNYATANGTASAGSDYVATNGTLNFGIGENSKTISVTINGDIAVESNETFFVNLSNATSPAIITDSQGLGTITDDDAAPVIGAVSIGDVIVTEGNAGTQVATFVVTRTSGTAAFSVNYATANGSATAGSDYGAVSGTLSFAAGVDSQNVTVTVFGDTTVEANETFFVNLSSLTSGGTLADAQGLGTITENDTAGDDFADSVNDTTAPFGNVVVNGAAAGNLESAGDHDLFAVALTAGVTYTIDLMGSPTSSGTLTDPYLYLRNSAGTIQGQDDDAGSGTNSRLVYTPGTSGTYYIDAAAFDDSYAGTYTVNVTAPGAVAGSVTISDVDIAEGNSGTQIATFTVARSGGTAAFAVNFATVNGSASAGSDYVAIPSGTLNFGAGVNSQTIAVTINGDTTDESDETFFVNLSGATNGATITDTQGQGTIIDNDDPVDGDDYADNISDATAPFGQVSIGGSATGSLEVAGDRDWFEVSLVAGQLYTIREQGSPTSHGTLLDSYLRLYDSSGQLLTLNDDVDYAHFNYDSQISFRAPATGTYYIAAGAYADGAYVGFLPNATYTASVILVDDYAGNASTAAQLFAGGTASGNLELLKDRDWFRVQVAAGHTYTFDLEGVDTAAGTLADPYLYLYSSSGKQVLVDDDSGAGTNSQLSFLATSSGTFYLAAGAYKDSATGTYEISMTESVGVTINGTKLGDTIDATHGIGGLFPTDGDDAINGLDGNDTLDGGIGNDTLSGGAGIDILVGGAGNDTFNISGTGDAFDSFSGGADTDTMKISAAVTLNGFDATADSIEAWLNTSVKLVGVTGAPGVGVAANQTFDLSGLNSITGVTFFDGGTGDDLMIGSNFADDLRGGAGSDTLRGGGGDDKLSGGKDKVVDTFVYATGGGHDTIMDLTFDKKDPLLDDHVDLTVAGVNDFGDLNMTAINSNKDVLIDFGGGDQLVIMKTTIATLIAHQGDFIFH